MNLKYTIAILTGVCAMALTGCGDLDNYDAPDGGIHGKVIDANTGEVVLQPVNASTGLRIRLIQQNWEVAADPQKMVHLQIPNFLMMNIQWSWSRRTSFR